MTREHFEKWVHISDIMLTICIECDNKFPIMIMSISTNIDKSCLKCRSSSSINQMMNIYDFLSEMSVEELFCIVERPVIYDKNLIKSPRKNILDHTDDSSSFIVSTDEKDDLIFLHDAFFRARSLVWDEWNFDALILLFVREGVRNKTEIQYWHRREHQLSERHQIYIRYDRQILEKIQEREVIIPHKEKPKSVKHWIALVVQHLEQP